MTARVAEIAARFARTLSFMIGAPDYERYVEHLRARHPGEKPLSRTEFARQRLEDRYAKAGGRCC